MAFAPVFLSDDDDDVRIAAIDAISEVGEDMREPLLEAFLEADDRPRIRIKILEIPCVAELVQIHNMRMRCGRSLQYKIAANEPGAAGYKNAILQKRASGNQPERNGR